MRSITHRFVLAMLAVAVIAAACGDDDGDPQAQSEAQAEAEDLLENLQEGLEEGESPEDLVEDAEAAAEDFLEGMGASEGSGVMEIHGETIEFATELCFSAQGDFSAAGAGTAADGTPVWVSVDYTEDSREELAEFLDEQMLDTLYGDADPVITQSIAVDFGRADLFGTAADDQPSFGADSTLTVAEGVSVEISVDGQSASGSGLAADYNTVVGDFDDTFEFSFEVSCG